MIIDLLPPTGVILCAVSGGVDSMYLLCRLAELGYPVAAAHYNHGLRGEEADRDEEFVSAFCRERDIPFLSERGDVSAYAAARHLGTEEAARILRYDFLERAADKLDAAVIATAHTANDNAETILMHMVRGSGLRGLSGIPPRRGRVIRPLLDSTRQEAEKYLLERGIPHVEDSTNAGGAYLRNRMRHGVMPLLEAENPGLVSALGRMAGLLREDEDFLEGLAREFLANHGEERSVPIPALLALPRPVARRAVRLMAGNIPAEQTERILRVAENGGAVDISGLRAAGSGGRLYFGAAKSDALLDRVLPSDGEVRLPEVGLAVRCEKIPEYPSDVNKSLNTFFFKYANICDSILVTARKPGDRYRPTGRGCTKTLKAIFEENGVPAWERESVPVLRDGCGVLAVYGAPPAERVQASPGDRDVLRIEFIRLTPDGEG